MRRNKTAGRKDRRDESMTAGCEEFQILRGGRLRKHAVRASRILRGAGTEAVRQHHAYDAMNGALAEGLEAPVVSDDSPSPRRQATALGSN